MVMLLFVDIDFSLASAAEVCEILKRTSSFDPTSESGALRYFKFATVSILL